MPPPWDLTIHRTLSLYMREKENGKNKLYPTTMGFHLKSSIIHVHHIT
jgi:hypothetical protein